MPTSPFVKKLLDELINSKSVNNLTLQQNDYIGTIAQNAQSSKGVYTVLVTLLVYKTIHPDQDIRLHQDNMEGGFSGRSFDTRCITPNLKALGLPAMAESGWLTRSLEQPSPYNLDYAGKISNQKVKQAFLAIIDEVEALKLHPKDALRVLMQKVACIAKQSQVAIEPLSQAKHLTIQIIIAILKDHFHFKYNTHGASKLPVLAFYAIYQILIREIDKYTNCTLAPLNSHTSSDKSSKAAGDIEVFRDNQLIEAIEIKLDRTIDPFVVRNVQSKIYAHNPATYYLLSNLSKIENADGIADLINEIKSEHGCELIINGVMDTLKYYLRLIGDLEEFLQNYCHLVQSDSELQPLHKTQLNDVLRHYGL